jgi:hypothetical protein
MFSSSQANIPISYTTDEVHLKWKSYEDEEKKEKMMMHRKTTSDGMNSLKVSEDTIHDIGHLCVGEGSTLDSSTYNFIESHFGFDFSKVRIHTDAKEPESALLVNASAYTIGKDTRFEAGLYQQGTKKGKLLLAHKLAHVIQQDNSLQNATLQQQSTSVIYEDYDLVDHNYNGEGKCSPTWFGETEPEVDPVSGGFTGKLVVRYNEAALKDQCVRECVEEHENVHVKDLTPIIKKIHNCDVAAKNDRDKENCNVMSNKEFNTEVKNRTECNAYKKSIACLRRKIRDSKNPCSKAPHRQEIKKHLGYELCEKEHYCKETKKTKSKKP